MRSCFLISNIQFEIDHPGNLEFPPHFKLFVVRNETWEKGSCYRYHIAWADREIDSSDVPTEWTLAAGREDILVYRQGEYEMRLLAARGREGFYGRYRELSDSESEIILDPSCPELLLQDTVFSSAFALERRAVELGDLVLHCAYTEHEGSAILFSAPSGVGKSTQAGLWEKYRGSSIQNGDRALLVKRESIWHACGWPVCGSSEICSNSSHSIKAIVTLSQESKNSVRSLSPMEAFRALYSEVTVNTWNRQASVRVMDLLEELINRVPVYHLGCDISEEAVRCLEEYL